MRERGAGGEKISGGPKRRIKEEKRRNLSTSETKRGALERLEGLKSRHFGEE